eukprot:gene26871-33518_t
MFLSDFSIKRPVAMIVLIVAMMAMGLLALSKLRVNQNPDVDIPVLIVNIPYPGASPETVEREIVNRLEKSLQSISGVTDSYSTSREGSATIELRFDFDKNLIEASDEVRNSIASVRYKLPTEMREPMIQRVDDSAQPVMQISLSSKNMSHAAISRLAEDKLADRFRGLDGVAVVNVNGALRRELSVLLRAEKLREYNVSVAEVADRYGKVIAWALHHRRWMAVIAFASFAGAIALQVKWGGTSFLPKSDFGSLAIEVRTPSSSSLEYTKMKMSKAAQIAHTIKEVEATSTYVNLSGGRIWVDIGKRSKRDRDATEIGVELRQKLAGLVGGEFVVLDDLSNNARKPVQIDFVGPDSRKLMEITNTFMDKLRQVPGAVDVGLSEQDPKDELQIELNRSLANSMGISAGDAAQALRVAFAGIEVGDWVDPTGETRDVAVRLHPADRVSLDNIERLPIGVSNTNMMVPLDQIARVTMGKGPSTIRHKNGKRTISVSANVEGRAHGEVISDAMKLAKSLDYPPGFGLAVGGSGKDQQEVFTQMGISLVAGIGLMYLVLVMQFGSFTAPGAVMLSLPLSLIGVVVGLLLTGGTLNLMSFIGVIMLMGLVAKNAILLLDAARKREEEGYGREDALMYAGRMRLRPILMTTFALIAGMMPVAIGMGEGGEFYRPMAIAIIGGTITSTFLTLLVVPTFYDSIEIARDRMIAKFHRRDARWGSALAFLLTFVEALLTLVFVRLVYRLLKWVVLKPEACRLIGAWRRPQASLERTLRGAGDPPLTLKPKYLPLIVAAALAAMSTSALASGYHFGSQSVAAQGSADANAAEADDASTLFYNPAGMSRLQGQHFSAGATAVVPHSSYTDTGSRRFTGTASGGTATDGYAPDFVVAPSLYYTKQINRQWTAGMGLFVPYGTKLNYGDNWNGRYALTNIKLEAIALNPSASFKLNEQHAFGFGVTAEFMKAELGQAVDVPGTVAALSGTPNSAALVRQIVALGGNPAALATVKDGRGENDGKDWGFGFNLGYLFQLNKDTRFGVSYRSPISHKLKGSTVWDFSSVTTDPVVNKVLAARSGWRRNCPAPAPPPAPGCRPRMPAAYHGGCCA